jgi:hypothetical protein
MGATNVTNHNDYESCVRERMRGSKKWIERNAPPGWRVRKSGKSFLASAPDVSSTASSTTSFLGYEASEEF